MTIDNLKYFSRQFIVLWVFIDFSRIIRYFHILKTYFSNKKQTNMIIPVMLEGGCGKSTEVIIKWIKFSKKPGVKKIYFLGEGIKENLKNV